MTARRRLPQLAEPATEHEERPLLLAEPGARLERHPGLVSRAYAEDPSPSCFPLGAQAETNGQILPTRPP